MLNLLHIYLVVVPVCADPLDPYDALLEVDGRDQAIIIALDVEDDAVGRDDAGSCVATLRFYRARPARLSDFVEPGVKGRLQCPVILVSAAPLDEVRRVTSA
jgi:hypothetical protein